MMHDVVKLPSIDDVLGLDPVEARAMRLRLATLLEAARVASGAASSPMPAVAPTVTIGEWLTAAEAAMLLRYSTRQVRRLTHDGTWTYGKHFVRQAGRRVRYHRPALEEWLRTQPLPSKMGLAFGAEI